MNFKVLFFASVSLALGQLTSVHAAHYEVFLLAGQSNMDGRAAVKDLTGELASYATPRSDVWIYFSGGGLHRPLTVSDGFQPLQPGFSGTPGNVPNALPTQTFGPEVSFGAAMAQALPGKQILLVKCAEGGTKLRSDWNPNERNKLYDRFLALVRQSGQMMRDKGDTFEIRGMLWHQGESDAELPAGEYEKMLTELVARVRTDLGLKELPFVIGEVFDNGKRGHVIAGEKAVAQAGPRIGFAESDGLNTYDKGTHFDAVSQIELGKRFAREMQRLLATEAAPGAKK